MNTDIGELGMRDDYGTAFVAVPPPRGEHPHRPPVQTDAPGVVLIFILAAAIVAFGIHAPKIFRKDRS